MTITDGCTIDAEMVDAALNSYFDGDRDWSEVDEVHMRHALTAAISHWMMRVSIATGHGDTASSLLGNIATFNSVASSSADESSDALKRCPFCGGGAEIVNIEEGENAGGSCVACKRCLASSNVEFERKENFISNWNRRADPDLLSLAKRWLALDAGSWAVERHAREKAELIKDTRAIIDIVESPIP